MSTLVTGLFSTRVGAEHAMDELIKAGFPRDNVSMLATEETPAQELVVQKGSRSIQVATIGAMIGGAVGALTAGVAAAGSMTVPDLPVLAAGPIIVALTGFAAGAAAGALTGAVVGQGMPGQEARFESGELEDDGIIAGVFVQDDRTLLARAVLDTCGAEKITRK